MPTKHSSLSELYLPSPWTKYCPGFSSPVADMGLSMREVAPHTCWFLSADRTSTRLHVLPADTNIWSDDTRSGKVPQNTNGLGIMVYKSEELVPGLFPPEISRLDTWGSDCQSMERSLYYHPIWSASHRRLMCLGKRQKAVGELLVLWVTTGSSKTEHPHSHWCLFLAVSFSLPEKQKMLPWKQSQNSVPTPSTP